MRHPGRRAAHICRSHRRNGGPEAGRPYRHKTCPCPPFHHQTCPMIPTSDISTALPEPPLHNEHHDSARWQQLHRHNRSKRGWSTVGGGPDTRRGQNARGCRMVRGHQQDTSSSSANSENSLHCTCTQDRNLNEHKHGENANVLNHTSRNFIQMAKRRHTFRCLTINSHDLKWWRLPEAHQIVAP